MRKMIKLVAVQGLGRVCKEGISPFSLNSGQLVLKFIINVKFLFPNPRMQITVQKSTKVVSFEFVHLEFQSTHSEAKVRLSSSHLLLLLILT